MALNVIKMIFYFEWEETGNGLYKTVTVKKPWLQEMNLLQ